MDKAERLYVYVNDCFTIDVMNSIFMENYEFINQTPFYSQLLDKFQISKSLLNTTVSDERFIETIASFRDGLNKCIREHLIYQFITYCSKMIDQKYLDGMDLHRDNAELRKQSLYYCEEKEKLVHELENSILEIQDRGEIDFIKEAAILLRNMEERVFEEFSLIRGEGKK